MKPITYAVALCVLCTLFASAIADDSMLFSEFLHSAKAGPSVRTASADYEKADVKSVCLREAKHYNCRYVGCPDMAVCTGNDNATACADCIHNIVFQSDLTCCGDYKDYGYGYDSGSLSGSDSRGLNTPYLRVGTCDWDIVLNDEGKCFFYPNAHPSVSGCPLTRQPSGLAPTASLLGTAFATCYLTDGVDYCDGLLCDKMVLSFQGSLYKTEALSPSAGIRLTNPDNWCEISPSKPTRKQPNAPTVKKYISGEEVELSPGTAVVATGAVVLTSLDKDLEYSHGQMDFVYDFFSDIQMPVNTELPIVRPNSYKLKLVGDKTTYYKK